MPLSKLNDPLKRYLVNGSCTVEAEVMLNEEQIKEEVKKKVNFDLRKGKQ
uniref:MATH domain-containing protein n=1 Tax=Ficus carica TaxID=3494 RepID=A0AA88EIZ0_FICCA|nr:hypothetical protein TIFTF001_056709 [Ficus carica]